MPILKFPNYGQLVPSKANYNWATDATNIVTIGNKSIPSINFSNSAALNALPADQWSNIQEINLGVPFYFQLSPVNASSHVLVHLVGETVGDYLRCQWVLDDIIIGDFTCGPNKYQDLNFLYFDIAISSPSIPVFSLGHFLVRLFKHGVFDAGNSFAWFGTIYYNEVVPV